MPFSASHSDVLMVEDFFLDFPLLRNRLMGKEGKKLKFCLGIQMISIAIMNSTFAVKIMQIR